MFDWFKGVPPAMEFVILLAAFVAGIYSLHKLVYLPLKRHFGRVNAGMDTLLGYPAVTDPGSGREIQPATPPLAARVYDLEAHQAKVADALTVIAANQVLLRQIQDDLASRDEVGKQIVAEWVKWREQHEDEAEAREERIAEWEAWRQEQNLLLEALKNSHEPPHNQPPEEQP